MALQGMNGGVLAFSGTGLEQAIEELKQICPLSGPAHPENKEIQQLVTAMNRIIAVLKDADRKQISSETDRLRLWELKQVVFDAEDLIDELTTDAAVQSIGAHIYNIPTRLMDQICEMNGRLDRLESQISMLAYQISTTQGSCPGLPTWRQTSSLLSDETSVIGRGREKEQIIEMLTDRFAESSSNNIKGFSIVPIVGLGGVGKTTLAQLVYNDEKVKNHFELRMWVCVSNDFDLRRLTKDITEAALVSKGMNEQYQVNNWDSMQRRLLQVVEGKTFLLVLDDVWEAEHSKWEALFKPLCLGKKGKYVSTDDCFRFEDQKLVETPDTTVHHVSVWVGRRDQIEITINELCCYERLRTLLLRTSTYWYHDLDQLFLKLKMLRVMGLRDCEIEELPGSIGDLKHLRYIDLERNRCLKRLPESLGNLYNLQVLNLNHCRSLYLLPSTMSQLVNLKHLQPYDRGLLSRIDGVGKLTGLQELQVRGIQLRELGGMCMLRQLKITDLEEVGSKEEAIQARLHTMERLQVLHLQWRNRWSSPIKPELEEEVLQALRPNAGIRKLHIEGYGGIMSPDWMEVSTLLNSFSLLKRVSLKDCPNWQVPTCSFLGQLRHLEYLEIDRMPKWEEWSCPVSWDCLQQLTVRDCPKLRRLDLFQVGISCLHSELDGCSRVDGGIETTSSPHSSPPTSASLSRLYISYCDNLTSISRLLQQQLPDLVVIEISYCKNLVSLPEKGFGHLVSLQSLKITYCPELTCLLPMPKEEEDASTQHLPCSLEELGICYCGDAMGGWWWTGLQHLTSLTQLSLRGCPTTIELLFDSLERNPHPHLPATLRELWIEGYNIFDDEQQSATSSSCSSQLSPPLTLPPIPDNNVDASAGVLRAFTSLEELTIRHCPNFLQRWGGWGLPSSLEQLTVAGDDDLSHEDLSACLHNLISLKQLTLENLSVLPDLSGLSSLETLDISHCPSIQSWPANACLCSMKLWLAKYKGMRAGIMLNKHVHVSCNLSSWDFTALVPDVIGVLHHFSSHSMHFVLSTLLLAAIVWEIWLSSNHAISKAFAVLGSSSASGTTPFAYYHSMGKASAIAAET
ncbi:hypothetical protein Taro_014957 [Colocasia esculenta]|uniref:Uncharacterized protein n=1 Tax=Colocasia esculenta TaxID=4460 RepID=A0A843UG19_COLES|nr:hypothetical protein [Colocasia esculenta]